MLELGFDERFAELLAARSPELQRDPYPLFGEIRERGAVVSYGSAVLVSRYEHVRVLCADLERFKRTHYDEGSFAEELRARVPAGERARYAEISAFERLFLSRTHGDQHARLRGLTHRAFTPRMVANLEGYTQAAFDELSAPMAEAESCDLVDGLSFRLPLLVIARMLGVPASDADMIHAWTLPMAAFMDRQDLSHIAPWHAAMQEFRGYVGELVRTMRGAPAETNLIAALLEASDEGTMTGEELVATFVILLFAGHETTTNLISNGVYRLLDGDGWDELRREPELAESAVEEMLRYDPPVQFTQRVPIVEVDVEGTTIAPNTTVMLMLAAANRDPRAWSEPDWFDIRRPRNRHLSFALGPVFCLGASLARMEARIVFSTLARRHPGLALAGEPEWAANAQLRGPVHLPVSLRSR